MIGRWSALLTRRTRLVLGAAVLVVLVAGGYGLGVFGSLSQGGFDTPGSESYREQTAERAALGNHAVDVVAIYSSPDTTADQPAFETAVRRVVAGLPRDTLARVVPYYDAPAAQRSSLVGDDGHAAQVLITLRGSSQDDFLHAYDRLEPHLTAPAGTGLRTRVAGGYAVYHDVNVITSADLERAELITTPVVILLALLIFGGLVAALMPAMVGVCAMLGALAVVRLLTLVTDVSVFAVNVVSLIGIGLAIDYALFVVSRFREELALLPPEEYADRVAARVAIGRTLATAGRTVLFSGLTVAAALSSLLVFPQAFLRSMGYGGVAAVLVAVTAALTVLPAVLLLLGRRIDAGRLPGRLGGRRPGDHDRPAATDGGAWARLARFVMARPVAMVSVVVVVLLAVASPFLGVRWGSVDERTLPASAPARVATAELAADFGPQTSTARILVHGADADGLAAYTRRLEAVPGIVAVEPVARTGHGSATDALLLASWRGSSQTQRSQDLARALRAVPEPPGTTVLVGGDSADTIDLEHSVAAHLPVMAAIIVAVMLVLLFLAFGSVVLPIKAVVMNAFSITASFGVVTWTFSDGHLSKLLGFSPEGFLDATNPILMLAVLFGLSMDYEVFLLSRVREAWDRTGDNDTAVATGVQRTGRIITSAALLLGVVIGAFGLSGIVFIKMLGVGMAVALLIDATIVRAILVPATMKLLGNANWWAPAPMRRWWERHGLREDDGPVGTSSLGLTPTTASSGRGAVVG